MAKKTKKELEQEQARGLTYQWEKETGGKLNDTQRATLQRMIELNSNSAQQDVRRSDYYNGGQSKYDVSKSSYQVRNDDTGRLNKRTREIFALKSGQQDEPQSNIYRSNEFAQQKARNYLDSLKQNDVEQPSNNVSVDPVKTTNERMQEKSSPKEPSFLGDVAYTLKKFGQVINPFDDVSAKQAIDEYLKNGWKGTNTQEINRFANRAMDSGTFGGSAALMKAVRGRDAVDWQNQREGVGNNIADFASTGLGYLLPGTGLAKGAKALGVGAKITEGMGTGAKLAQYAKEGVITGGMLGALETPAREYVNPELTAQDHLKYIGMNAGLGLIGDPAIHGVGSVIGKLQATKALNQLEKMGGVPKQELNPKVEYTPTMSKSQKESTGVYDNLIQQAKNQQESRYPLQSNVVEPTFIPIPNRPASVKIPNVVKQNKDFMEIPPVKNNSAPVSSNVVEPSTPISSMTTQQYAEEIANIKSKINFARMMGIEPSAELQQQLRQLEEQAVQATKRANDIKDNLQFGYNAKNEPTARKSSLEDAVQNVVNEEYYQGKSQAYWQQRYEDFVNHVNTSYDTNRLSKEALDELWTHFAKKDENVTLEQLADLAYKGQGNRLWREQALSQLPFQGANKPSSRPAKSLQQAVEDVAQMLRAQDPPLKERLHGDEKLNELVKKLFHSNPKSSSLPKITVKKMDTSPIPSKKNSILSVKWRDDPVVPNEPIKPKPQTNQSGTVLFDEPVKVTKDTKWEDIAPKGAEKPKSSKMKVPEGSQAMTAPPIPLPNANGATSETITRQTILDNIKKNFGIVIRTGRLNAPEDVQGLYKVNPEVVRSRNHGDLQVISHEIGHHLDKKFNLSNPQFDQELMALGAKTSGSNYTPDQIRAEGIAEYIRLHLVEPQEAVKQAPQFSKYFDQIVSSDKKTAAALTQTQNDISTWINQGEFNQARGQINFREDMGPIARVKEKLQNARQTADKLYTDTVDKLHPLAIVEKEINGGKLADASESLYKKARLAAGTPRIAEQKLHELQPILAQLDKIGSTRKDLSHYLAMVHARDLAGNGERVANDATTAAGNLLNVLAGKKPQEVQREIASFEKTWGVELGKKQLADLHNGKGLTLTPAQLQQIKDANYIESGFSEGQINESIKKLDSPEMKSIQQEIVKYNNSLLDMLVDAQILTQKQVDAMRTKYPNYVPFFRHFDEEMTAGLTGKGFVDLTNPIKRMKGSTKDIIDPLENIVKNTFSVIQAAQKNKVGLELDRLAQKEGAGKWIEKLDGHAPVRNEQIVTVYKDGEKVQYQLAPELYRAMKALDKEPMSKLVSILAKPTDWLRAGATLTPEFALRNPIRDQFNATVVSDVGYNPLDLFRGLNEILKVKTGKGSPIYDEWVKQGGAYGGYLSPDRDVLKQNLDSITQSGTKLQRAVKNVVNPNKWLEGLQKVSEISEEATKVGAYKKGVKKGLTPEESAYQARELMDFNRMGNTMQTANRLYAFLNANVQGKDKLIRAFKENPVRTASRITGMTVPPTALAYASYEWANDKQKEIMDNMPQWEKDTYWAVAVPGTDLVARIPKPFDISGLPNTIEKGLDYFGKGDPYAFENKDTGEKLWELGSALTPTIAKPLMENMANYSFFTGGPIVPQRDQNNSPKEQYGPTTSETAKGIANVLDKLGIQASPYKIDNAYRGYTAGLGQYPQAALDKVMSALTGNKAPTPVAKSFTESAPGVKAFFTNDMNGGKVMDDYYRIMEQQQQISADAKKHGEEPPNAEELKAFNKVNKELGKLRTQYNQVMADTEMSPEDKRAQIDELNAQMRDLARQGIMIFRPDYR